MAGIVVPVVLAVGAGSAIAAATNDGNVIRACSAKNGKTLHLAGADGKCAKGETALAWNQKAPAGVGAAPENVVGGDPLSGGQAEAFVKIDGIAGESADPAHLNEIDVKAFAFGGKNSGGSASGGAGGAGKVAFSDVTFAKLYDASSPNSSSGWPPASTTSSAT